jgi:hypothetical protein
LRDEAGDRHARAPRPRGHARALKILDDAAPRHGWELRFVLARPDPLVAAEGLPAERITYLPAVRRWRSWSARLTLPLAVRRLARLARGADVFYACTLSSFPYCLLAGRIARVPQVVHVYSSYVDGAAYRKHLLAAPATSWRPRRIRSRSRARRSVGSRPARGRTSSTTGWIGAHRARGDGPGTRRARRRRAARRDGREPRRAEEPRALVEALARVRATVPAVRALLVGAFRDPTYEATVRARIAALGLGDAVTVTGFLANPFPVVRALDVLVHPARRDPFPLALLEGMALARPIVASAVGGIPEMIEDGASGVLVPADDAGRLADAVTALLRIPPRGRASAPPPASGSRPGSRARRSRPPCSRLRRGSGMTPDVAVIVPTYERAHVLGASLASVLARTA